jgi:hypothetical protein
MNLGKKELIAEIALSSSIKEAAELYKMFEGILKNYVFILSFDKSSAAIPGLAVDKNFSKTGAIRGLYKYNNVFILSEKTVDSLLSGKKQEIPIDYSISLDTQAVSYLYSYFFDRDKSGLPKDLDEFFRFIIEPDVNVDPIPHLTENTYNLKCGGNLDKIYNVKLAYEMFRNLDVDIFKNENKLKFKKTDLEIQEIAQQQISQEIFRLTDEQFNAEYERMFHQQYIIILIIAIIRWKYSNKSIYTQIYSYFEMNQKYLGLMSVRDANLAYAIFTKKSKFFKKIEKNSNTLVEKMKAMAWDIFHFRYLEKVSTYSINENADYFFPALCSFDDDFVKLIEFYKLSGLVYNKNGTDIYPFYAFGMDEMTELSDKHKMQIQEAFFTSEAIIERQNTYETKRNRFSQSVIELEEELFNLKKQ